MLSFLPVDQNMSFSSLQLNPLREVQELFQTHGWDLQFTVSKKGHIYLVEAEVNGENVHASASATNASTKEAKKIVAEQLIAELKVKSICCFFFFFFPLSLAYYDLNHVKC